MANAKRYFVRCSGCLSAVAVEPADPKAFLLSFKGWNVAPPECEGETKWHDRSQKTSDAY